MTEEHDNEEIESDQDEIEELDEEDKTCAMMNLPGLYSINKFHNFKSTEF